MTIINPIEDLMNYYYFQLIVCYCIIGILILTTIALFKNHIKSIYTILISTLSLAALISKQYFLGVIADNIQNSISLYIKQERVLLYLGCILLLIQICISLKRKK